MSIGKLLRKFLGQKPENTEVPETKEERAQKVLKFWLEDNVRIIVENSCKFPKRNAQVYEIFIRDFTKDYEHNPNDLQYLVVYEYFNGKFWKQTSMWFSEKEIELER